MKAHEAIGTGSGVVMAGGIAAQIAQAGGTNAEVTFSISALVVITSLLGVLASVVVYQQKQTEKLHAEAIAARDAERDRLIADNTLLREDRDLTRKALIDALTTSVRATAIAQKATA